MSQWFDIDLSDGTRLNLGKSDSSKLAHIAIYLFASFVCGFIVYLLTSKLMWWPFSWILHSVLSFLAIRNVLQYLVPPHIARYLQRKNRQE